MSSNGMVIPDSNEVIKVANTYRIYSERPFKPEAVEKILKEVLTEGMENLSYDPEKCASQAVWAVGTIMTRLKEMDFERYKLICMVTIGEKLSQDFLSTMGFLVDPERDRYAQFSLENTHVFGMACCFGIYYE